MKTIQVRRTRHAGHCWRSKDELISDVLLWTPTYAKQKQDDQLELTYSSSVRTQDVTLKRRWNNRRSGEWGSRISVLAARHDDVDDRTDVPIKTFEQSLRCFVTVNFSSFWSSDKESLTCILYILRCGPLWQGLSSFSGYLFIYVIILIIVNGFILYLLYLCYISVLHLLNGISIFVGYLIKKNIL